MQANASSTSASGHEGLGSHWRPERARDGCPAALAVRNFASVLVQRRKRLAASANVKYRGTCFVGSIFKVFNDWRFSSISVLTEDAYISRSAFGVSEFVKFPLRLRVEVPPYSSRAYGIFCTLVPARVVLLEPIVNLLSNVLEFK